MDRKRQRDDVLYGGPSKRPNGGRVVGPSGQAAASNRLTTNDALSYLREVKNKFADNKQVYDTFLEIMKEFKASRVDTAGVIVRVKELFKGHRELILGFNTFLPKGYEIEMPLEEEDDKAQPKQPVEFDQAINYVNKIKTRFASDERVYKAFLEILNMYRKGQKTITNVYEEVAMLFKNHSDLLNEFTYFLPDSTPPSQQAKKLGGRAKAVHPTRTTGYERFPQKRKGRRGEEVYEDEEGFARTNLSKELHFFEKVKMRLRNRESYQDFLKCLNLYAQEVISKSELTSLVHELIGRFSDLAIAFHDFLGRCEMMDFEIDGKMASRGQMTIRDIARIKQLSQAEKLAKCPISELDVSDWERNGVSYVRLPPNYPKMRCSGRTPDLDSMLNNTWVSVTSGSEDYSFKHMRKNQYEEALFRVEDDRFELDMMIETNASALRAMTTLAQELETLEPEARARWSPPEGALNAVQMRAAQRIYGESGQQIVDLLRKNPAVAIPVVLARLVQKDSEWRASKANMAPLWQKVYDANYHKSLDHRSFYFKQTDKRLLGAKGMLADIREAVEKRRANDSGLAAVSAAADFSARLHDDMYFEYPVRNVHEDVYTILRTAIKEMLTPDVAIKMLSFFNGLVEDMFGLDPRPVEEASEQASGDTQEEEQVQSPKAVAKHKRLAMLRDEGNGADTDTDTAAPDADAEREEPDSMAAPAPIPNVLGGLTQAAEAVGETEAAAAADAAGRPAAANGDANSGVSSDAAAADADKADAEGPSAMAVDGPQGAHSSKDSGMQDFSGATSDEEKEEAEEAYKACKPLAAAVRTAPAANLTPSSSDAEADAAAAPEAGRPRPRRLFYGNDAFYVFFRLHQYLYDRLRVAHTCSHKKQGYGSGANAEGEGRSPEEYHATHAKFMSLVNDLIVGTLDASQYEDQCRALLGTGSYMLFTLEKLIYKIVKQLQMLVQDDVANSLFELYKYEHARSEPPSDATYFANAHVLLHDDTCFRFAMLPKDRLTIQMMDPDKSEVPAGGLDPGFMSYLKGFVENSASPADGAGRVFLLRNFPHAARSNPATVAPPPTGVEVTNGLECKISCATSKVSYVLDTEDVFRRLKRKPAAPAPTAVAARTDKFRGWQEQQRHQPQQWLPPGVIA